MNRHAARIRSDADGVEVSIPSKRHPWMLFMLPVWLCGWLPMGWSVAAELHFPHAVADCGALFFELAWLAIWLIGSLWVVGTLLWSACGVERVHFARDEVSLSRQISAFHWCLIYQARDVRYLRAFRPLRFAVAGGGYDERCRIAFDYRGKTVFFACGVAEDDAFRLVHEIKARAPWFDIR